MFRKFAIALGTTALIGAAALVPTTASAHWHHHFHGYGLGLGLGLGLVAASTPVLIEPSCYYVKQKVPTGFGGWTWQTVQVCN